MTISSNGASVPLSLPPVQPVQPALWLAPVEDVVAAHPIPGLVVEPEGVGHRVQSGQTLSGITTLYQGSFGTTATWRGVHDANRWMADPSRIYRSMPTIEIPGLNDEVARERGAIGGLTEWRGELRHSVRPGETLSSIASMYRESFGLDVTGPALARANPEVISDPNRISTAMIPLRVPGLVEHLEAVDARPSGLVQVDGAYQHQVRTGDTIVSILRVYHDAFGVDATPEQVRAANPGRVIPTGPLASTIGSIEIPGLEQAVASVLDRLPGLAIDGGDITYTVRGGDTLSAIARATNSALGTSNSWQALHAANTNQISNPSLIRPGQVLHVPGVFEHAAPPIGDTRPVRVSALDGAVGAATISRLSYASGRVAAQTLQPFRIEAPGAFDLGVIDPADAERILRDAMLSGELHDGAIVQTRDGRAHLVALAPDRASGGNWGPGVNANVALELVNPAVLAAGSYDEAWQLHVATR